MYMCVFVYVHSVCACVCVCVCGSSFAAGASVGYNLGGVEGVSVSVCLSVRVCVLHIWAVAFSSVGLKSSCKVVGWWLVVVLFV